MWPGRPLESELSEAVGKRVTLDRESGRSRLPLDPQGVGVTCTNLREHVWRRSKNRDEERLQWYGV